MMLVFFFKEKKAYEMRISDWSSDVCSSDLPDERLGEIHNHGVRLILDADPASGFDVKLTLSGWRNESDTRAMQALALTPGTDRVLNSRAQAAFSTNPDLIAYLGYTLGGKGAPLEWENGLLADWAPAGPTAAVLDMITIRSEEHTSELQSLMRISYAVFCLKKKKQHKTNK